MKKILAMVAIIFLTIGVTKPLAYSQGIVNTHPTYKHPVTGLVEDPGNNPAIGQGMVEGVVHPQALLEESNGTLYLSLRLYMADHLGNVRFYYDNNTSYVELGYQITNESSDYKDYRLMIPSTDLVLRITMYVEPMGREVVYFSTISGYQEGNTDFVSLAPIDNKDQVSMDQDQTRAQNPDPSSKIIQESQNPSQGTSPGPNIADQGGPRPKQEDLGQIQASYQASSPAERLPYDHGLLLRGNKKLQGLGVNTGFEVQEDINLEDLDDTDQGEALGPVTRTGIYLLYFLGLVISLANLGIGIYIYLNVKKIKIENEVLKERYYEN